MSKASGNTLSRFDGGKLAVLGAADPLPDSANNGDEVVITDDGTTNGTVLKEYIYSGTEWVELHQYYAAEYLHASVNTHTDYTTGGNVTDYTVNSSAGGLTVNSSGIVRLSAGVTYKLTGALNGANGTAPDWFIAQWYDVTASATVGNPGLMMAVTSSESYTAQPTANAIFRPDVDTDVVLRITGIGSGTFKLDAGYGYIIVEAIAGQLPVFDTIASKDDVQTLPHTQQITIAKGAALRCFDGVNWEADVVEGTANTDVIFMTPWGIGLMTSAGNQQAYIYNNTGSTQFFQLDWNYIFGGGAASHGGRNVTYSTGIGNLGWVALTWEPGHNFPHAGDTEHTRLRMYTSVAAYTAGDYLEFEITAIIGSGYNNNFFRVRRLR